MSTPKLRRILPLFFGALLLAAIAEAATVKEPFNKTLPLRPGSEIRLANTNGSVSFDAWDRNEVKIEAEKQVKAGSNDEARRVMSKVTIAVTQDAKGVRIETKHPRLENGFFDWILGHHANVSVNYRIHVPRRAELVAENVNGPLKVTGTRGKAHMETINGVVTIKDVQGDLELETTNGGIDVIRSAGALRAVTTNGSVDAELTGLTDDSDLSFETTNGRVSLRLPRDARLSIDAATTNGRVQSDFEVAGSKPGKRSLRGDINGGGGKLYIRTTNGGVDISEL